MGEALLSIRFNQMEEAPVFHSIEPNGKGYFPIQFNQMGKSSLLHSGEPQGSKELLAIRIIEWEGVSSPHG